MYIFRAVSDEKFQEVLKKITEETEKLVEDFEKLMQLKKAEKTKRTLLRES